jgi:simple sugar transport system ATP-binding protein
MTGITKRFRGVTANDRISFEVRRGEIHGLLGENGAGKTTLMRVLYGLLAPDAGSIEVNRQVVTVPNPKAARRLGIAMVHQHFMLVPNMSVAENVALVGPAEPSAKSSIRDASRTVRTLAEQFGFSVAPEQVIEHLSVGQQQQVEILKAVSSGADTLILDEPTALLMPTEWEHLAEILTTLARAGSSVIFITHKLAELRHLADRCTVLRDGRVIGTVIVEDVDEASLARMMVGRDVVLRVEREPLDPGAEVLEVRDLTLLDTDGRELLGHLDFAVREREVLGVAGVEGNGQSELVEVLAGLRQPTTGRIVLNGEPAPGLSPRTFTASGGALIPEDRQRTGLALELNVSDNLIMKEATTRRFARRGFLKASAVNSYASELLSAFDVRVSDPTVLVRQLSGGTQQKVVLARELSRRPKLLIAAQPTRGLDVGATEFVYREILEHRSRGGATLLISNELDEILSLSDRIAVIVKGHVVAVVDTADATLERLGLLMAGELR